jgi:site-specific DNA-cytosine methylase
MTERTYNVLQLFAGMGGGCLGFGRAEIDYKGVRARFRTVGAVDIDPGACEALEYLTGNQATQLDLFTRDQYRDFHGHEPPDTWREATPADLRAVTIGPQQLGKRTVRMGRRPNVVFASPPCKGLSSLLSAAKSASPKYQALNQLVTRWLFLVLEAWRERFPRAARRREAAFGRRTSHMILLAGHLRLRYRPHRETAHYLTRWHAEGPPELLILENVPRIRQRGVELLNTVRALLRAYGYAIDERVHDCGHLGGLGQTRKRFLLVARRIATCPALLYEPVPFPLRTIGDVIGALPPPGDPECGAIHQLPKLHWATWQRLALIPAGGDWRKLAERWKDGPWGLVPVPKGEGKRLNNVYRLVRLDGAAALNIREPSEYAAKWPTQGMAVQSAGAPSRTVTGTMDMQSGALGVADPRLNIAPRNGTMGVQDWDGPGVTVTGSVDVHAGTAAVADPRGESADQPPLIISDDGCWHRPLTVLELCALQGFPTHVRGAPLTLPGKSAKNWRMWNGNAVPPAAAQAIAEMMLATLTCTELFGGDHQGNTGIWVREAGLLRWVSVPPVERCVSPREVARARGCAQSEMHDRHGGV